MKKLANKAITVKEILIDLLEVREDPCVSIIVNKDAPSPRNENFRIAIKNSIREALKKLKEKNYDKKIIEKFEDELWKLEDKIKYERDFQSVVFFKSPSVQELILLPFEVKNKVIVDNSFEIRDLLRTVNRSFQYDVIILSKKQTRFFNGFQNHLQEVFVPELPQGVNYYLESRINEKSDPGKAEIEALKLYTADIDHFLRIYSDISTPLIVMGDKKLTAYFRKNSKRPKKILAEIYGSYDSERISEIEKKINESLKEFNRKRDKELLEKIQPELDKLNYVSGIQEVWTAAAMKEARMLLVEHGYKVEGYSVKNGLFLIFGKPDDEEYEYHADAIDDLAEMVLSQGAEVYFLEKGLLEKFDKVLLITRG